MTAKLMALFNQVQAREGGGGAAARVDAEGIEGEEDQGAVDEARALLGLPRGRRGRLGRGGGPQRPQEQIQAEERSDILL